MYTVNIVNFTAYEDHFAETTNAEATGPPTESTGRAIRRTASAVPA
jgi:hypothetical protein